MKAGNFPSGASLPPRDSLADRILRATLLGPRRAGRTLFLFSAPLVAVMLLGAAQGGLLADSLQRVFMNICHQRPERSFAWAEPFCVCHRCFGIYVGFALGGLLAWLGAHFDVENRRILAACVLLIPLHVAVGYLAPAADLWWLRLITGLVFGAWGTLALALTLGRAMARAEGHEKRDK